MSTPEDQPRKRGGPRKPPGARVPPVFPCSNGGGLFCEKAWAGLAEKLELSPRQMEIARCILADQSHGKIAQALGLSRGTVHTHVERLHEKLHVHSRVQLATLVFRHLPFVAHRVASPDGLSAAQPTCVVLMRR